jgi:hypothetical protein
MAGDDNGGVAPALDGDGLKIYHIRPLIRPFFFCYSAFNIFYRIPSSLIFGLLILNLIPILQ